MAREGGRDNRGVLVDDATARQELDQEQACRDRQVRGGNTSGREGGFENWVAAMFCMPERKKHDSPFFLVGACAEFIRKRGGRKASWDSWDEETSHRERQRSAPTGRTRADLNERDS